jgi:competence ComEA-like helix-hairpin-helix protein
MKIAGFLLLAFFSPAFAIAAELININTADATLLDTLPGIGPTYAGRIIDYRTAHGPFVSTEDIQNVSGIGPSTYANIAPLITVGEAASQPSATAVASSTPAAVTASGRATEGAPPAALSLRIDGDENAVLGVPLRLTARATNKGVIDSSAQILWSFGDGSSAAGSTAEKLYRYAGTYLIVVTATDGAVAARGELTVTVKPAYVRLLAIPGEGIRVMNESSERLDLSGWQILAERSSFRIPVGMTVLPNESALLPYAITHLPMSSDIALAFPDGVIAARSAPTAPVQPSLATARYEQVQTVESVATTNISGTAYEETAVRAPTAPTELAAVGAALSAPAPEEDSRLSTLFRSPWTLSFIGLMALAGGAFIFL